MRNQQLYKQAATLIRNKNLKNLSELLTGFLKIIRMLHEFISRIHQIQKFNAA
jgi:hypothetical protein